MKLRLVAVMLASLFAAAANAQEVRFARVVSVVPIEKMFSSYELVGPICTTRMVPVERQVPVYRDVYDSGSPVAGMIIGAVIGNRLFDSSSSSRTAGTIVGAVVGSSIASDTRRTIVEYRTEIHYVENRTCERRSELVTRPVIDGYSVTYEMDGILRNVKMKSRPGDFIRITTTTTIDP